MVLGPVSLRLYAGAVLGSSFPAFPLGFRFRASDAKPNHKVRNSELKVNTLNLKARFNRVSGLGFRVLGFRVQGLGL